jgi:hypothetical protein
LVLELLLLRKGESVWRFGWRCRVVVNGDAVFHSAVWWELVREFVWKDILVRQDEGFEVRWDGIWESGRCVVVHGSNES